MCGCVDTFKHEYLRDQRVDRNQIFSEASLRCGGKAALGFDADQIRTLISMATDSSLRVIMGKMVSRFLDCFIRSLSYLWVTIT